MRYFDDVEFLRGDAVEGCAAVIDQRFPDFYSVEFMRAGRMSFGVDGQPGFVLSWPAVFWHHPAHSYQYGAVDASGWSHRYLLLRGERARRLVEEGFMRLSPAWYVSVRKPEAVDAIFHELAAMAHSRPDRHRGELLIGLERLLCLLDAERRDGLTEEEGRHGDAVGKLADRIAEAPLTNWDFGQEAAKAGLSYSHFRRLFKRMVGQPPHDYVLSCRVRAAAEVLRRGGRSVKEVADELGFKDLASFCRLFRKRMGLSPGRYRNAVPY